MRRSSFENKFWKCPIYHPTWRYYGTIIHPASNIILPWLFSAESGFFGKNHLPQFQIFWQPFLAQLLHMFGYQPSKIILRFVYSKKVNPKLNIFTCCWAPVVKKNAHPSVQRGSFDFFVGCSVAVGPWKTPSFFRCEIVILHGSFHQVWRHNGSLTAHAPAAQISITGRSWYRWQPWPLMATEWRFSELW